MSRKAMRTLATALALVLCPLLGYFGIAWLDRAHPPQSDPAADLPRGQPIDAPAPPPGAIPRGGTVSPEAFAAFGDVKGFSQQDAALEFKKTKDGGHFKVNFKQLGSYTYVVPDPIALKKAVDPAALLGNQIPEALKKLDGQPVVIVGFVVPFEVSAEGLITSFALTQNQNFCCYGIPPALNEMVMVEMGDQVSGTLQTDQPTAIFGQLQVGEELKDGYVLSLYQMKAEKLMDLPELLADLAEEEGV